MEINRHLNILDYALRAMTRRWGYHLYVFVILGIGVFISASLVLMVQSLIFETSAILKAVPDITVIQQSLGRQVPIEKEKTDPIKKILGVSSAYPRIWGYYFDPYSSAIFTLWGIDPALLAKLQSQDMTVIKGNVWEAGERHKVLMGEGVLKSLGLEKRKNFALKNTADDLVNFEVSGIFSTSSSLLTGDLIIMDEKDIHDFFNLPDKLAADIAVEVANPAEIHTIAFKIEDLFPSCKCILRSQLKQSYAAVFDHRAGLLLYSWLGCIISFVLVLWLKGSHLPLEEQQEVGLLKASGWGISDILEMKAFEALILSFLAFGAGFCAAYSHIYLLNAFLFKPMLLGWSVLYPDFGLVPMVSFSRFAFIFIFTALPYIGVSMMASWKFTSMDTAVLLIGSKS